MRRRKAGKEKKRGVKRERKKERKEKGESLRAGGVKESRSVSLPGPKLGILDGGANSTLMDGGAI
jgi:hypothetical protein